MQDTLAGYFMLLENAQKSIHGCKRKKAQSGLLGSRSTQPHDMTTSLRNRHAVNEGKTRELLVGCEVAEQDAESHAAPRCGSKTHGVLPEPRRRPALMTDVALVKTKLMPCPCRISRAPP